MREGLKAEDHHLSERAKGNPPLTHGPLKGVTINMERLQEEFFKIVGWSYAGGGPTPEKLNALGIDSLLKFNSIN